MRSEGDLRQKLKQVQYRHLKRMLREVFPADEEWDRDSVQTLKNDFKVLVATAPLHQLAKDFPDLAALMWALGEEREDLVPGATLVGSLGGVYLWADTPAQADDARTILDKLAAQSDAPKKSWWQGLFK